MLSKGIKKKKKKKASQGKSCMQLLKTLAKKERAVNVEEIRLPWKLCAYKENLLAEEQG